MSKFSKKLAAGILAVAMTVTGVGFSAPDYYAAEKSTVNAASQKALNAALGKGSVNTINIKTDKSIKLIIPKSTKSNARINVDGSNVALVNRAAGLGGVYITDAKSYTEQGSGSIVNIKDDKIKLVFGKNAEDAVVTLSNDKADVTVVNKSENDNKLVIKGAGEISISNALGTLNVKDKTEGKAVITESAADGTGETAGNSSGAGESASTTEAAATGSAASASSGSSGSGSATGSGSSSPRYAKRTVPSEDPTPVDPTPVDPTPVDPTPVDPTPVDPTPVDPTPVDPTPVDPTPVDPDPVAPVEKRLVKEASSTGVTYEYKYDEKGRMVYTIERDVNDIVVNEETKEYDDDNRLVKYSKTETEVYHLSTLRDENNMIMCMKDPKGTVIRGEDSDQYILDITAVVEDWKSVDGICVGYFSDEDSYFQNMSVSSESNDEPEARHKMEPINYVTDKLYDKGLWECNEILSFKFDEGDTFGEFILDISCEDEVPVILGKVELLSEGEVVYSEEYDEEKGEELLSGVKVESRIEDRTVSIDSYTYDENGYLSDKVEDYEYTSYNIETGEVTYYMSDRETSYKNPYKEGYENERVYGVDRDRYYYELMETLYNDDGTVAGVFKYRKDAPDADKTVVGSTLYSYEYDDENRMTKKVADGQNYKNTMTTVWNEDGTSDSVYISEDNSGETAIIEKYATIHTEYDAKKNVVKEIAEVYTVEDEEKVLSHIKTDEYVYDDNNNMISHTINLDYAQTTNGYYNELMEWAYFENGNVMLEKKTSDYSGSTYISEVQYNENGLPVYEKHVSQGRTGERTRLYSELGVLLKDESHIIDEDMDYTIVFEYNEAGILIHSNEQRYEQDELVLGEEKRYEYDEHGSPVIKNEINLHVYDYVDGNGEAQKGTQVNIEYITYNNEYDEDGYAVSSTVEFYDMGRWDHYYVWDEETGEYNKYPRGEDDPGFFIDSYSWTIIYDWEQGNTVIVPQTYEKYQEIK